MSVVLSVNRWKLWVFAPMVIWSFLGCDISEPVAVRPSQQVYLPSCHSSVGSPQMGTKVLNGYNSCTYSADHGPSANPNPALIPSELKYFSLPFGKSFDLLHLSAVLSASARGTWMYIRENFPVEIYAMPPADYQSCQLFQELEYAPSNVRCAFNNQQQYVSQARRQSPTRSAGVLQGLYWAAGVVQQNQYQLGRAIIFVRSDASRWTLVHEFLHHLFHQERIRTGGPVVLQRDLARSELMLKNSLERLHEPTETTLEEAVVALEEVTFNTLQILNQNELEEVAIEYLLLDLYSWGLLQYTENNTSGSISYVRSSSAEAQFKLDQLMGLVDQTRDTLRRAGATSLQQSRIDTLSGQILDVSEELQEINDHIQRHLFRQSFP